MPKVLSSTAVWVGPGSGTDLDAVRVRPVAHRDVPVPAVGFDQQIIGRRPARRCVLRVISLCAQPIEPGDRAVDPHQAFAARLQAQNNPLARRASGRVTLPLNQPYSHLAPQGVPTGMGWNAPGSSLFGGELSGW